MNIDYMRIRDLLDEITDPIHGFSDELIEVTVDNIHHLTQTLFEFLSDIALDSDLNAGMPEGLIHGTIDRLYDRAVANIRDIEDDDGDVVANLLARYIDDGLVTVPAVETTTSRDILERLLESLESYVSDGSENMRILRIKRDRFEEAWKILANNTFTMSRRGATGIFSRYLMVILNFEDLIDETAVMQYTSHVPIEILRSKVRHINDSMEKYLQFSYDSVAGKIESYSGQRRQHLEDRHEGIFESLYDQLQLPTDDESLKSLFVSEKIDDLPTTKLRSDIESLLDDVRNLEH